MKELMRISDASWASHDMKVNGAAFNTKKKIVNQLEERRDGEEEFDEAEHKEKRKASLPRDLNSMLQSIIYTTIDNIPRNMKITTQSLVKLYSAKMSPRRQVNEFDKQLLDKLNNVRDEILEFRHVILPKVEELFKGLVNMPMTYHQFIFQKCRTYLSAISPTSQVSCDLSRS